jgi:Leucine-rich repeat (LRR) protein
MHRIISTLILTIGFFRILSASEIIGSAAGPGCTISFQQVVTDNPNGCSDSEDGFICVTINGTVSDEFELSINNGLSWTYGKKTICFEDLPSGSYNLQIKEQSGCTVVYSGNPVVLGIDDPVTINEIMTSPQTFSELGYIAVNASGMPPLQYRVNNGSWQFSDKFLDLIAGTYTVDVKDINGCIVSDEATVADERCPEFTVDKTIETNCFLPNASITITTVIGIRPFTYSNDNGSTWQSDSVFSNLSGGVYPMAVKGDNGCISYNITNVSTSFVQFSGSSSVVNVAGCMGDPTGEIHASSFGGQIPKTYSIDNGVSWQSSGTFTGLIAGVYTTMVRDNWGCTDTTDFTITQPIHDTIDFVMVENVSGCTGDSTGQMAIDVLFPAPPASNNKGASVTKHYSIDGGVTWQTSSFFNHLPAGEYTAVIQIDDCEYPYFLNPVLIEEPAPIEIAEVEIGGDYGNSSGELTITATGGGKGYEYSIDGGATFSFEDTFTGLVKGAYHLAVRDYNGCSADSIVAVPDLSVQIVSVESTDVEGCFGDTTGTITISTTGGEGAISYSIDNGTTWQLSNVFNDLAAGDYTIKAKDENDIETSWTSNPVTLYEPDEISFSYRGYSPTCVGESTGRILFRSADGGTGDFTYSVDGGITYTSNNPVTGLAAGSYNLYLKDENGCIKEYQRNPVEIYAPFPFEIFGVEVMDNTSCSENGNGMITIITAAGEGGGQSQFIDPESAEAFGSYYFSIDDTASWQQDINTFGNLEVGSYQIWAKNPDGCVAEWEENPVVIDFVNPISFKNIDVTGDDGRHNGEIYADVVGGDSPYNYRLDDGVWQLSERFTNLAAGTYSLQVHDSDGCENSEEVIVDSLVYIPDGNFKSYLIGNSSINTNGDEEIQPAEARTFTGAISVMNLGISDMTGIEAFINLTSLFCYTNVFSSLDVSKNKKLTILNCNYNNLSELDVSNNTALTDLSCGENFLTALDLSENRNLTMLQCAYNSLIEIDLSNNVALTRLFCAQNSLTSLDLRNGNNANITNIDCKNNDLTCVSVDNDLYAATNWSAYFDAGVTFSLDCNPIPEDETIENTNFNAGDTTCFGAYQTITVGDAAGNPVDFNSGSSTSLIAGSSITLLPGVHIYQGAYLSASITTDSSFCDIAEAFVSPVVATDKTDKSKELPGIQKDAGNQLQLQTLRVFPNPNNGRFVVELSGFSEKTGLIIFNSLGSMVYNDVDIEEKSSLEIGELKRGLYFIKAFDGTHTMTKKMIVE